jgi:hypothetical protein
MLFVSVEIVAKIIEGPKFNAKQLLHLVEIDNSVIVYSKIEL